MEKVGLPIPTNDFAFPQLPIAGQAGYEAQPQSYAPAEYTVQEYVRYYNWYMSQTGGQPIMEEEEEEEEEEELPPGMEGPPGMEAPPGLASFRR